MIGTFKHNHSVVIGGGLSGMLISYALLQKGHSVELIEKSDRLGGLIRTTTLNGGMAEWAAHSMLVSDAHVKFFKEIGVNLVKLNPKSKARYIVRNGKPRTIPLTLIEALKLIWFYFTKKSDPEPGTTLSQWAEHRLGKTALDYLVNPFVSGVYGCSPQELLARFAFPKLFSKKQKRIPSVMSAPQDGMESFIDALASKLKSFSAFKLKLGCEIKSLESFTDKNIILTLPLENCAQLFQRSLPLLSQAAAQVPYSPLISVGVFYNQSSFKKVPRGVGVLIPEIERCEDLRILGILYNSSSFSNRATVPTLESFTVMLGGTGDSNALQLSDSQILDRVRRAFHMLFGVTDEFIEVEIHRHLRAVPIYGKQLYEFHQYAAQTWCSKEGNLFFGNYTGQVSIRGMIETVLTLLK
jgi:oxygen-dependent protoporphyrinogen oxidase